MYRLAFAIALVAASTASAIAAPPWCATPGVERLDVPDLQSLYREPEAHRALYGIVAATCVPDNDARAQATKIERLRLDWTKKLYMIEVDWADVAHWSTSDLSNRMDSMFTRPDDKLAFSAFTPAHQFERMEADPDPAYLADLLGERLTQAGRMGYLLRCLKGPPLAWAMCADDVAAFDAAKLSAEVRADTRLDGHQRTRLRLDAFELAPELAKHAARVRDTLASDPAYAQMFAIAKTAPAEMAKVPSALRTLVAELDDARRTRSRKASDGCVDRTWSVLSGVVAKIPASTFTGFDPDRRHAFLEQAYAKVVASPEGYLAALSFAMCHAIAGNGDTLVHTIHELIARWPGFRGPRTATHSLVLAAGITFDDRDQKLEAPEVHRGWLHFTLNGRNDRGTGTVETVKRDGDKLVVAFAKVKGTQQKCVRGRYTNRVTQIRSDGVLVYEYICLEERTETYAEPPAPPQELDPRYATGIAPGMFITAIEGVVVVAYAKGKKTPSYLTGVALK